MRFYTRPLCAANLASFFQPLPTSKIQTMRNINILTEKQVFPAMEPTSDAK